MVMIHRHAMQKIKVKVRQFKTYGHALGNNNVVSTAEHLSGAGGNECSEDRERKIFYELGRAGPMSFHVDSGGAPATSCSGCEHLPSTFEPLPPPPYHLQCESQNLTLGGILKSSLQQLRIFNQNFTHIMYI